jgi:TRAP-type transport system small permease protein
MSDERLNHSSLVNGSVGPRSIFESALNWLVALCVFALIALTFVDVVGRYVFSLPIPGGFELVEIVLALSIFSALPLVTARSEHISVGIFEPFFRGSLRWMQQIVVRGATAVMLAFLTGWMWSQAENYRLGSTRTLSLHLPVAPVLYVITLFSVLAFVAAVLLLIQSLMKARHAPGNPNLH